MSNVVQLFRQMTAPKLAIIGGVMLVIIIGFLLILLRGSVQPMVILYSDLDIKDSNKIIGELEAQRIPYELKINGTQILVPQDQVLKIRMNMAESGIPSKGSLIGYEIFDASETLGTSSFVQNVNLLRALEGELSRTISAFHNIESTRVHLVIPKRELFSRTKEEPSASVIIAMKGKNQLSKDQINAVSHLVATAVGGLDVANITIVDTLGRSLKLGSANSDDPGIIASNSEDFRVSFENRLKRTIEELLGQSVGFNQVKAQVSAEINFDRIVTNSEIYDPNGQVIRSIQEVDDKETTTDKSGSDNVSVSTNLPAGQKTLDGKIQNSSESEHSDTTTNYEISKTIKNYVSETGNVKRLSIAVLVDGTYKVDKKTNEVTYIPRSIEELDKYSTLVKSAVGFDASRNDKVEIVNMQFIADLDQLKSKTTIELVKEELPNLAQTVTIGIVVMLALLLVVRPIALRAFESTKVDLDDTIEEEPDLAFTNSDSADQEGEEGMIDIAKIEAKFKNNDALKTINDIVGKYPTETLATLRRWVDGAN